MIVGGCWGGDYHHGKFPGLNRDAKSGKSGAKRKKRNLAAGGLAVNKKERETRLRGRSCTEASKTARLKKKTEKKKEQQRTRGSQEKIGMRKGGYSPLSCWGRENWTNRRFRES